MLRPYSELVLDDLMVYDPAIDPTYARYIVEALVEMGHIYDDEVEDGELVVDVDLDPSGANDDRQLSFDFDVVTTEDNPQKP